MDPPHVAKMRAGEVELHAVEGAAERAEIRAVGCKRTLIEARAAVAKAKADFMTAKGKAAAEAADVEAKTLRLEADGLIKPAPTADTELASSTKKQRTVATQSV